MIYKISRIANEGSVAFQIITMFTKMSRSKNIKKINNLKILENIMQILEIASQLSV